VIVLVQTQLSDSTVTGSSAADTCEYDSAVPGVTRYSIIDMEHIHVSYKKGYFHYKCGNLNMVI
jgi:hypothetical protein